MLDPGSIPAPIATSPTITSAKTLLFVFLLAGLGLGGWMLVGQDGEDWSDVAYGQDPSTPLAEDEFGDPIDGPTADSGGRAAATRTNLAPVVKPPKAYPLPKANEIDASLGFRVRAIRKDTQAPIAGASILYYDTIAARYRAFRRLRRQYEADKEVALSQAGERVLTDEDGFAFVPHGIPPQSLVARFEGFYGELQLSKKNDPPPDGYVLELEPDRTIRVRVVDAAGDPVVGIPLAYYVGIRGEDGLLTWALWRDPDRDTRSTDGIQHLPHVQRFVSVLEKLGKSDPIVHIGIDVPGMTRCGPTLNLEEIPTEVIDVVYSPVGSVEVLVVDQDGAPVQRKVRLSTEPDFAGSQRPSWQLQTDAEGRVLFGKVAIGTGLRVESTGSRVTEDERAKLMGPERAGEVVKVELVKEFTAAFVEGIAADEQGRRLANTSLRYSAPTSKGRADTEYLASGTLRTDDQGRFTLRLPPSVGATHLYSILGLSTAGEGTLQAAAKVKLPERLPKARHSVGTVRLKLPTLIASGRTYMNDEPMKFYDRFILDFRNPENKNRWERVTDVKVHGKRGGYFEVRGDLRGRKLRLRPRYTGTLPITPIMLSSGQRGIDVRFYSAGTLRIAVLFDTETADANMQVMLRPITIDYQQNNPLLKWHFVGRVDKRASGNLNFRRVYWWTGLPPGRYRVELRLLGQERPFAVLDQLQPTFKKRFDEVEPSIINLRGQVRRVHIVAQDVKGRPIRGMVIPIGQTAIETQEGVQLGAKGAVLHTMRRDGVDVLVAAKGYRTERAYGVTDKRIVRMRPGVPITVDLAALRVPRGVKITVSMRRRSYDYSRLYRSALRHPLNGRAGARPLTVLLGERTVTLRHRGKRQWKATVMEHGKFRLYVQLSLQGKKPVYLRGFGPSNLMVRDTATEHRFTVKVSKSRVTQALRSLGVQPIPPKKKR